MAVKENFEYESLHDAQSIGAYLKALRKGIESGSISLTSGDEEMSLNPADLLHMSVRARKKGRDSQIHIKIMWKEKGEKTNGADKESLEIT